MYDLSHYREIDDAFLAKQKAKLRNFLVVFALFVVLLAVGFLGLGMNKNVINTSFDQNITWARNSTDTAEKIAYYQKAIQIKPADETPYLEMINLFKADAVFTLDEEKTLIEALTPNLTQLREQPFYPDLAFEIGKLYWYYYAYGRTDADPAMSGSEALDDNNQSTRMISSIQWFADVMQYGGTSGSNYSIAKIYHDIGDFHKNIATNVAEASDVGKYKLYWNNLNDLVSYVRTSNNEPEIVKLTLDSIVLNAISTYARKFKSDGITESDMRTTLSNVVADARNVSASTDKTIDMQNKIVNTLAGLASTAVDNAFRSDTDTRGLQYGS